MRVCAREHVVVDVIAAIVPAQPHYVSVSESGSSARAQATQPGTSSLGIAAEEEPTHFVLPIKQINPSAKCAAALLTAQTFYLL